MIELHLTAAPDGAQVKSAAALTEDELAEIATMVGWMLALDQDLSAFYAAAQHEPKLAHVAERAQGRLLRSPTLFEDVVKTILTTNTTWSGTIRMVQALVDLFGDSLSAEPVRRAFPLPKSIAQADVETLRQEARLGYPRPMCWSWPTTSMPARSIWKHSRPPISPPMSCANGCAPSKVWGHTPSPTC